MNFLQQENKLVCCKPQLFQITFIYVFILIIQLLIIVTEVKCQCKHQLKTSDIAYSTQEHF